MINPLLTAVLTLSIAKVASAEFRLEVEECPAGYVMRSHTTQSGLSVCTCNQQIVDLILCEEDQETLVIRVSERMGREGGRERGREGGREGDKVFLPCHSY